MSKMKNFIVFVTLLSLIACSNFDSQKSSQETTSNNEGTDNAQRQGAKEDDDQQSQDFQRDISTAIAVKGVNLYKRIGSKSKKLILDIEVVHSSLPSKLVQTYEGTYANFEVEGDQRTLMVFLTESQRSVFSGEIESIKYNSVKITLENAKSVELDLDYIKSQKIKTNVDLNKVWDVNDLPTNPDPGSNPVN